MASVPSPFDGKCPDCGKEFSLADLKRMAVGDGWKRYILVEREGKVEPVTFEDFDPVNMRPFKPA